MIIEYQTLIIYGVKGQKVGWERVGKNAPPRLILLWKYPAISRVKEVAHGDTVISSHVMSSPLTPGHVYLLVHLARLFTLGHL